jgi:hypothetical protein
MATIGELHTAIMNGWTAEVKRLANDLRSSGIDISGEIQFAKKIAKVRGGTWKNIVEVIA